MAQNKTTWDPKLAKIYWHMPPPGPPSKSELEVYEKFIKTLKNKKDAKILILGSTPTIRDFCLKYKVAHLCVDYYKENFYIAKKMLKYKGKEEIMAADWRKMELPEKYDLIIGDIPFGMVPFSTLDHVLIRLQRALKDNGLIVQRTWMRKKDDFRGKKFEEYLKKIHPIRRKVVHPFTSLGMPFVLHFYDEKREQILFSQNLPKLKKYIKKGLLTQEDYDYFELFWGRYKLANYYPLKPKFEKKIKKYFKIKKIMHGKDWFKDYAPIYILNKKI